MTQSGGGNIHFLLVKVTGSEKDLDEFCGQDTIYRSIPKAVLEAGFGEPDYITVASRN